MSLRPWQNCVCALGLALGVAGYGQAQTYGGRMSSTYRPEEPSVDLPSNQPTFMTSINYPLIYGAYAVWPYAIPVSFSYGSGLPSRLNDMSMRPTPVVTRAYGPSLAAPATSAMVNVVLPGNAELWFEGMQVPGNGYLRRFFSPELDPMMAYAYDVRASWYENGRVVSQGQRVLVRAGDRLTVRFPASRDPMSPPIDQERLNVAPEIVRLPR